MAGGDDIGRGLKEFGEGAGQILDTVSSPPSDLGLGGLVAFFEKPDNLLALAVCLAAVAGIYRLLRSEGVIPAPKRRGGGLLASPFARRMALRIMFLVVVAALGLALAVGRMAGLHDVLKRFF